MSEVIKKPVKITETILRDAHQSLIATRTGRWWPGMLQFMGSQRVRHD